MLAELLAERGLKALGEVIIKKKGRRAEPDILLILNGIKIIIEGRKSGQWDSLIGTATERLDNGLCDLCVILEYPEFTIANLAPTQLDIKNALLKAKYKVGFLSFADRIGLEKFMEIKPKPEAFENITFDELLSHIMDAYSRVIREEILQPVIQKIDDALTDFSDKITEGVSLDRLRDVLELRPKDDDEGEEDNE